MAIFPGTLLRENRLFIHKKISYPYQSILTTCLQLTHGLLPVFGESFHATLDELFLENMGFFMRKRKLRNKKKSTRDRSAFSSL